MAGAILVGIVVRLLRGLSNLGMLSKAVRIVPGLCPADICKGVLLNISIRCTGLRGDGAGWLEVGGECVQVGLQDVGLAR